MKLQLVFMCATVAVALCESRASGVEAWERIESKRIGFAVLFSDAIAAWRISSVDVELSTDENALRIRKDGNVVASQKLVGGFWGNIVVSEDGTEIFALSNVGDKEGYRADGIFYVNLDATTVKFGRVPLEASRVTGINDVEVDGLMLSGPIENHLLVMLSTQVRDGEWTHTVRFPAFLDIESGGLKRVGEFKIETIPTDTTDESGP